MAASPKPICYGSPYLTYFPPPSKREPPPVTNSATNSSREEVRDSQLPFPIYLHRLHFSIYGPAVQLEHLDLQNGRKSKLSTTQFSNSHRFFALTTVFGMERPNLRGMESTGIPSLEQPDTVNLAHSSAIVEFKEIYRKLRHYSSTIFNFEKMTCSFLSAAAFSWLCNFSIVTFNKYR
ncbi:hypothetical protein AVEN_121205-1 [Araneus ventricosus]|uniref:Uncharacterized protein n=1 Tax=Araneus ventricosus TaxID=182803 RepID=A0A4Y2IFG5_ARAVE|nr:hypothetical protein AVEN_121205-1 [Araneus ventricosus]